MFAVSTMEKNKVVVDFLKRKSLTKKSLRTVLKKIRKQLTLWFRERAV